MISFFLWLGAVINALASIVWLSNGERGISFFFAVACILSFYLHTLTNKDPEE